jgi:hypothetical protein
MCPKLDHCDSIHFQQSLVSLSFDSTCLVEQIKTSLVFHVYFLPTNSKTFSIVTVIKYLEMVLQCQKIVDQGFRFCLNVSLRASSFLGWLTPWTVHLLKRKIFQWFDREYHHYLSFILIGIDLNAVVVISCKCASRRPNLKKKFF